MRPAYPLSFRSVVSNDPLFWCVLALGLGGAFLVRDLKTYCPDPTRCEACGYDVAKLDGPACTECGHLIAPWQLQALKRTTSQAD